MLLFSTRCCHAEGKHPIQITIQDHIDGSITLLLRSPGYKLNNDSGIENIGVDVYFTPRELSVADPCHNTNITALIQSFGEDFVLPHLHSFVTHCKVEDVKPPLMPGDARSSHSCNVTESFIAYGKKMLSDNGGWLPPQVPDTGMHLHYLCLPHDVSPTPPNKDINLGTGSSDINAPIPSDISTTTISNITESYILLDPDWWRDADLATIDIEALSPASQPPRTLSLSTSMSSPSLYTATNSVFGEPRESRALQLIPELTTTGLMCAIISIGLQTDRALDELDLDDLLIPHLRQLVSTVRSSKWESTLCSSGYGLQPDEAAHLKIALLEDLAGGILLAGGGDCDEVNTFLSP